MRACSLVCMISVIFLIIDQFYSELRWERLFIGRLGGEPNFNTWR